MNKEKSFRLLGYCGLILLMATVSINGTWQRRFWLLSAICLSIYSMYKRDKVNTLVNIWIMLVNLYYLI